MSRPMTRSYAKAHNNLVSATSMGDTENLAAKLDCFMEQIATRQHVLEEQMAGLSMVVRGAATQEVVAKDVVTMRRTKRNRSLGDPWFSYTPNWNLLMKL